VLDIVHCLGYVQYTTFRDFPSDFELLDVVILTERIPMLYIIHLLLILMTVIISGFTVSSFRLISES
jgi:hypothetical protein